MRCRTCDYSLWTIASRACPECGAPFLPSEFEFRRGAVAFRCQHCRQDYYGTSPQGHLEPSSFRCVRCGNQIAMDEMVLEPAMGGEAGEAETQAFANPWDDRAKRGRIKAWFQTVGAVLTNPSRFADALRVGATTTEAWKFLVPTLAVFFFLKTLCSAFAFVSFVPGRAGLGIALLVLQTVVELLLRIAIVFAVAGWTHGILRASSAAKYPFPRTLQLVIFAEGATLPLQIIPCAGTLVSIVWWFTALTVMIARGQRCSTAVAFVGPLGGLFLAVAMSIAVWLGSQFMMAPVAGRGGSIFQSGMSGGSGYVDADVADAILESAATGAATPLDAVVAGSLSGEMLMRLIAPNGTTAGIGELTQSDILLGAGRQSVMDESARLAKRLPPNNAPYRIGCAVFCHRDLPSDDEADIGANWVVVVTPRTVGEMVHVVTRDGSHDVPLANFEAALAVEQARRARLNVPPLPDPFTIPDVYTGLISPQPKPGIPSTESRPASPPSDPGSEPSSEPGSDPEPGPDS